MLQRSCTIVECKAISLTSNIEAAERWQPERRIVVLVLLLCLLCSGEYHTLYLGRLVGIVDRQVDIVPVLYLLLVFRADMYKQEN